MREKLIELLRNGILVAMDDDNRYKYSDVVDYMMHHGVTIAKDTNVPSKWIPVSERLPKKFNNTLAVRKCGDWFSVGVECILADGKWSGDVFEKNEVTHWMPLPLLPKEGE